MNLGQDVVRIGVACSLEVYSRCEENPCRMGQILFGLDRHNHAKEGLESMRRWVLDNWGFRNVDETAFVSGFLKSNEIWKINNLNFEMKRNFIVNETRTNTRQNRVRLHILIINGCSSYKLDFLNSRNFP